MGVLKKIPGFPLMPFKKPIMIAVVMQELVYERRGRRTRLRKLKIFCMRRA